MRCGCGLIAEAVELTRELCPIHPDCYRNDFATRFHAYGTSLRTRGLSEGARDAGAEATQELCRDYPDRCQ